MKKTTKLTIYHNNSCSKSCSALAALKETGTAFELIEYLKEVPTVEDLTAIVSKLNCLPHDLIRKTEAIYIEKFKGKMLSDEQWIQAMHEYPILIQRPIILNGEQAVVARSSETLQQLIDNLNKP